MELVFHPKPLMRWWDSIKTCEKSWLKKIIITCKEISNLIELRWNYYNEIFLNIYSARLGNNVSLFPRVKVYRHFRLVTAEY